MVFLKDVTCYAMLCSLSRTKAMAFLKGVVGMRGLSSFLYRAQEVGSEDYFWKTRMQLPWGDHQEVPRGRRRREAWRGVRPHPGWPISPLPLPSGPLGMYGPRLWSFTPFGDRLVWVWALFLHMTRPWFGSVVGFLPLGPFVLRNKVLRFVSLRILNVFSMYSRNALLQMVKHQNLWKLLSLKPYV